MIALDRMWRRARAPACGRALLQGLLRLPAGDADALQSDREAGEVHHREHAGQPAVLLADQVSHRAALIPYTMVQVGEA